MYFTVLHPPLYLPEQLLLQIICKFLTDCSKHWIYFCHVQSKFMTFCLILILVSNVSIVLVDTLVSRKQYQCWLMDSYKSYSMLWNWLIWNMEGYCSYHMTNCAYPGFYTIMYIINTCIYKLLISCDCIAS